MNNPMLSLFDAQELKEELWRRGFTWDNEDFYDPNERHEPIPPHCPGEDKCLLCMTLAVYMGKLEDNIFNARPILWRMVAKSDEDTDDSRPDRNVPVNILFHGSHR